MADEKKALMDNAKSAFLKLTEEGDRLMFIDWCRRENDKVLFQGVRKATDAAVEDLKKGVHMGADMAQEASKVAADTGKDVLDSLRRGADSFEKAMKDFLGGEKK